MKGKFSSFYFIIILTLLGCSKESETSFNREHYKNENYFPSIIADNKIRVRETFEVSGTKSESTTKLRSVHYFNSLGQCTLKISPRYYFREADTTGMYLIKGADSLFAMFGRKETDIRSESNDTVIFEYDSRNRLVRQTEITPRSPGRQWRSDLIITYDSHNNVISKCIISHDSENMCSYMNILYKDEKILSITDSMPVSNLVYGDDSHTKLNTYNYDETGYLVYDGEYNYEYDKHGRVKRLYQSHDNEIFNEQVYTYDEEGRVVAIKSRYRKSIIDDYYMYNNIGLIIESKRLENTGVDPRILKFYYK